MKITFNVGKRKRCGQRICQTLLASICFVLFSSQTVMAQTDNTDTLVVATYAYPGLDRENAVAPIQAWLAQETQKPVSIRVASSPTELASWAEQHVIDVAVPNLTAYLKIRQQDMGAHFIAVPKNYRPHVIKSQYQGSIIAKGIGSFNELNRQLNKGNSVTVFAVFPDSTTGALIGLSKLRHSLSDSQFKKLQLVYAGSHEQVIEQLSHHGFGIGIVAASAYSRVNQDSRITELWRSGNVPFGPITCLPKRLSCDALKQALARNMSANQQILTGLKNGWPEFEHTDSLSFHEHKVYSDLLREQLINN